MGSRDGLRALLAFACVVSAVSAARADEPVVTPPPAEPVVLPDAPAIVDGRLASLDDGIGDRFAAWASERFFAGAIPSGETLLFLTEVGARFGLTSDSRLRADWGVAYSSSHVAGTIVDSAGVEMPYDARVSRVEARNAVFAVEWAPRIDRTRFSFGLGTALPVAGALNNPGTAEEAAQWAATTVTHQRMLATAGGLDPWRYRSERFALFVPIELLFPLDAMTISLAGAAGLSIPVIGASGAGVTGDLQATAQISGDVIPELRMGLRAAVSVLDIGATPASGTATEVQPSVTGWLRVQVAPAFVMVSLLADLGGPYGLGRANGVYAVTVGAGASM
jgi:hypothetical protein